MARQVATGTPATTGITATAKAPEKTVAVATPWNLATASPPADECNAKDTATAGTVAEAGMPTIAMTPETEKGMPK